MKLLGQYFKVGDYDLTFEDKTSFVPLYGEKEVGELRTIKVTVMKHKPISEGNKLKSKKAEEVVELARVVKEAFKDLTPDNRKGKE
jgi:hypothetical protein